MTGSFESRTADWLSVEEALGRIMRQAAPLAAVAVPISESLGLALAEDVVAEATLPPWDNSAMDGYAVRGEDVIGARSDTPVALPVARVVHAGESPGDPLPRGQAIRIMTGAPLPPDADTVVRVEDTDAEAESGVVRILDDRDVGHHIRPAGRDMRRGERLLAEGHTVSPGTVGVLAAAGRSTVRVHRRPSVALLTTGNELRDPDRFDEVRRGLGVPDSNGPMLEAMITRAGAIPVSLGAAPDDATELAARIREGADADVLVTVGGASMGEADLVKRVLVGLGYRQDFWRVRMRPGSPIGFGWLPRGDRLQPVFGLPGNPTSAFVTFEVFVRPYLLTVGGHVEVERRRMRCRAAERIDAPRGLAHFLRVEFDGRGTDTMIRLTGPQGSGLVSGLARAGGLAVVDEESDGANPGDEVTVILIEDR